MNELPDNLLERLVLGRYRIVRLLAEGGMGAVYLARVEGAAGFAKPVVVKRILPHLSELEDDRAQFIREAKILSNLRHPGIVNVLDFGKLDGSHLMVLDYVHGYHLGQWQKYVSQTRGNLPWEICVLVMLQVLNALQYAHTFTRSDGSRAGIIHRDISPANILLDIDGSIRLADFGIARMEAEQTVKDGQSVPTFKGKFPYAAPELFSNEKATAASDLYACGVVLYQLLAGINPFSGADPKVIIARVLTHTPPPISSIRNDAPKELDDVLRRVLTKEAKSRFTSAKDFASALRAVLSRPEAELQTEMNALIRQDFTSDMPRVIGRPSLDELEDSWRKYSSIGYVPLLSSAPPTFRPPALGTLHREREVTAETASPRVVAALPSPTPSAVNFNRRLVLGMIGAALLAAGVATASVLALRTRAPATEPRYLVVESGSDKEDSGTAIAAAAAASGPLTSASSTPSPERESNPAPASKTARVETKSRDTSGDLSRTFAKRQPAIQSCFRTNAQTVSGAPELFIRFSIDTQGRVTSAEVRPGAVAATPLGQCLGQVARSTSFGPQEKALAFSIPITARAR